MLKGVVDRLVISTEVVEIKIDYFPFLQAIDKNAHAVSCSSSNTLKILFFFF